MKLIPRVLLGVLTVSYPFVVWYGLTHWRPAVVGAALLACALPGAVSRFSRATPAERWGVLQVPLAIAALVALTATFDDQRFLLALPVGINLILLAGFARSLSGVPMVERFARLQVKDLPPDEVVYCRSVTKVWCGFFVFNAVITAVLAIAAPTAWWALYTGGIAYGFIALLFAGEFTVRKIRFRRYGPGPLDRLFRHFFPPRHA